MSFLKMPTALRWIWVNCIILLLLMIGYRFFLIYLFATESTPKISILLFGMIYDAGTIGFVGILAVLLTIFKQLHPYRSKKGFQFFLIFFSVTLFSILLIHAMDLVSIKTFGQRLSGSKIGILFRGNPKLKTYLRNFPIFSFIVGVVLTQWVWWIVINWLHLNLGILDRAINKVTRYTWFSVSCLIFTIFICLGIVLILKYNFPEDIIIGQSINTSLKINPFFGLIFL